MTSDRDDRDDEIWTAWTTAEGGASALDEDCSPTSACRNARDFSFDGFAEEGHDLQTAWREKLAREGKLNGSTESIRDLVFDQATSD